jgi:hypothetical protein
MHSDNEAQAPVVCRGTQFDISGTKAKVEAIERSGVRIKVDGVAKPVTLDFGFIEHALAHQGE